MSECIFCRIVRKELPSHTVHESDAFLAFLDINPNTPGMTLVIPKRHYGSDLFALPEDAFHDLLAEARIVAKKMEHALGVNRIALVCEGMGVDHMHVKLYPLHGVGKEFQEIWATEKAFFETYPGYLTTVLGPRADDGTLAAIAAKIRSAQDTPDQDL